MWLYVINKTKTSVDILPVYTCVRVLTNVYIRTCMYVCVRAARTCACVLEYIYIYIYIYNMNSFFWCSSFVGFLCGRYVMAENMDQKPVSPKMKNCRKIQHQIISFRSVAFNHGFLFFLPFVDKVSPSPPSFGRRPETCKDG